MRYHLILLTLVLCVGQMCGGPAVPSGDDEAGQSDVQTPPDSDQISNPGQTPGESPSNGSTNGGPTATYGTIQIANDTDYLITEVDVSASTETTWGEDDMPAGDTIPKGWAFPIQVNSELTWDLRVMDAQGTVGYKLGVTVGAGAVLDIWVSQLVIASQAGHTLVSLASGGKITAPDGMSVEVLPGTGASDTYLKITPSGTPGAQDATGRVVSREYDISAYRLNGALHASVICQFPVDLAGIATPLDNLGFVVQGYDTTSKAWVPASGVVPYDPATNMVTFPARHFSKYRVKYIGLTCDYGAWYTPYDDIKLRKSMLPTEHFNIEYYECVSPTQTSEYVIQDDTAWRILCKDDAAWKRLVGEKRVGDPSIPDYMEGMACALEDAFKYYMSLKDVSGTKVWADPGRMYCEVTYVPDAAGVFSFWEVGASRFKMMAQFSSYHDMRTCVAHELAHAICDERYNMVEATANIWFFEAIATLWPVGTCELTRNEAVAWYKEAMTKDYVYSSLDSSSPGSMYSAADFLEYACNWSGRPTLIEDVIMSSHFSDLSGLENVLGGTGLKLGDLYAEYARVSLASSYDCAAMREPTKRELTAAAPAWQYQFQRPYLSAEKTEISTNVAEDSMLVATAGRQVSSTPLRTFSYSSLAPTPLPAPASVRSSYLELNTTEGKPITVKHFGKQGASGVTSSLLRQVIVNPQTSFSFAHPAGAIFAFDYYLLIPPKVSVDSARSGGIRWDYTTPSVGAVAYSYGSYTYSDDGIPVTGFNVYQGGRLLNSSPLARDARSFYDAANPINSPDDAVVTVVDKYGDEWPEPPSAPSTIDLSGKSWAYVGFMGYPGLDDSPLERTATGRLATGPNTHNLRDTNPPGADDWLSDCTDTVKAEMEGTVAELTYSVSLGSRFTTSHSAKDESGKSVYDVHSHTATKTWFVLQTVGASGQVVASVESTSGTFPKVVIKKEEGIAHVMVRWYMTTQDVNERTGAPLGTSQYEGVTLDITLTFK